jgi:hypothetical protein
LKYSVIGNENPASKIYKENVPTLEEMFDELGKSYPTQTKKLNDMKDTLDMIHRETHNINNMFKSATNPLRSGLPFS